MLQILVSSTFIDLVPERECVQRIIGELTGQGYPVKWVGMEAFGSQATTALEASRQFTELADLVILIVGGSYGSRPPEESRSFTAEEYEVVRTNKIPCLAYLKELTPDRISQDAAEFRKQISSELTCSMFSSLESLERRVRSDLVRELGAAREGAGDPQLVPDAPVLGDVAAFTDRGAELEALADLLEPEEARVGVVGAAGIGKTTLVQEFFRRYHERLADPIWLRVDELFGRDAFGHLRVGAPRWKPESLADAVMALREKRRRAVLVFDNVQAAPIEVRRTLDRLAAGRALFLAWDTTSLPASVRALPIAPLDPVDSRRLFESFCDPDQRLESGPLADLVELTAGDPLLISLAGRRLATTPGLTVRELRDDLRASHEELLRLEGPTVDRPNIQVRALLKSVYLSLEPWQRAALAALGSLPSRGMSEASMAWAVARFGPERARRLDRALQIGLLDARPAADYRGHRYRIRTIVQEFLGTMDARPAAQRAVADYLLSDEALHDPSVDIVAEALRQQLARDGPALPGRGAWFIPLLVEARPVIRARAGQVLEQVRDSGQLGHLAKAAAVALDVPRRESVTLELLHLLGNWAIEESRPVLERLWLKPRTSQAGEDEPSLYHTVAAAAGKALARLDGLDYPTWLLGRMKGTYTQVSAALEAAASDKLEAALPAIVSCLADPDRRIRSAACDSLSSFSPIPDVADRLLALHDDDRNAGVRQEAMMTLGVWRDVRVLPALFRALESAHQDTAATAVSALWHYRRSDVADRLATAAQRSDTALNTKASIAFVLTDFLDPRAVDLAVSLMDTDDRYGQGVGLYITAMLGDLPDLEGEHRASLVDRLARFVAGDDLSFRLRARAALFALGDESGLNGLWADLSVDAAGASKEDNARWFAVWELASATPLLPRVDALRLSPLLDDPDPRMRGAAALVAGQIRARVLVPALEGLLHDESDGGAGETVGSIASEALDRIAGRRPPWVPHELSPVARPP
jgi:HEAT repeat protein